MNMTLIDSPFTSKGWTGCYFSLLQYANPGSTCTAARTAIGNGLLVFTGNSWRNSAVSFCGVEPLGDAAQAAQVQIDSS